MNGDQALAILATMADLRLNAERLAAENGQLRQALDVASAFRHDGAHDGNAQPQADDRSADS